MTQVERYRARERINHWAIALCFVLLALSGLALFHPSLFFLTHLLGGGVWTRILHPFIGVLMFALFAALALRLWHANWITALDRQWLKQWQDVLAGRKERLPDAGRFNGGQKLLFWVMAGSMLILLLTGIGLWRPYFAPLLPITLVRWAALLHSAAAVVLILGIVVHVYAAFWVKGTLDAMLGGKVSAAWARKHHRAWYQSLQDRQP